MDCQNFAQRILELEVQLEQNHSFQTIKALNQLYGKGIDYYIDNDPKKARVLQKKIAQLLKRPSVLQVLESNTALKNISANEVGQKLNRKLRNQIDIEIKYLMQQSKQCVKRVQKLKNLDIHKQQQILNDRIQTRGKSKAKHKQFISMKQIRFKDTDK